MLTCETSFLCLKSIQPDVSHFSLVHFTLCCHVFQHQVSAKLHGSFLLFMCDVSNECSSGYNTLVDFVVILLTFVSEILNSVIFVD